MKKIFSLLVTVLLLSASTTKTQASGEFTTNFNSVYEIAQDGTTVVTHLITLKNNLANIFATDYTLATSGDHLTHVSAKDESGPLTTTTSQQSGVTTMHIAIARPAVGKDKTENITLSYQTTDVVEKLGTTTTINIPRLSRANEAETYTRTVRVRGLSDQKVLIYPPPNTTTQEDTTTVYTFVGHTSDSLTLLFGDSLTYKLNLTYLLKNKDLTSINSELALPPDTDYQHILLNSLTPKPVEIRIDSDGNWLARYNLKPQEQLEVTAELYATVYPVPTRFDPSSHTLNSTHSKYWDGSASIVSDLANKLKTPENIYNYLISNFTYNYAGVGDGTKRLGAATALTSPSLVLCTEFTDTFVALARSNAIPSREINGYGFTSNVTLKPLSSATDVLHAWPEYYDSGKGQWRSIDPTWGNTTGGINYFNQLDFSHIAFVRHGQEDAYPLPAGAYKTSPSQKFVNVEIATTIPAERVSFETKGNVITNTGNVAIQNDTVGYLPPYGSFTIQSPRGLSLYDKIRALCVHLLSKFSQLLRAST